MVKKFEKSLSNESINEELDSSICESIDEISNLEIERLEKEIKSKLNVDYETYIKQFWVGLLEGDGTITVSAPGANYVKVRFIISIKNLRENVLMLLLVQKVLGGTVKIERKAQYVTWIAKKKRLGTKFNRVAATQLRYAATLRSCVAQALKLLLLRYIYRGRKEGERYKKKYIYIFFCVHLKTISFIN